METLIVARHAEADSNLGARVNGLAPGEALSPAGGEQARALGRALVGERIDLCAVTEFRRAQETADVALDGLEVPRLVLPELNEIHFGRFEGGSLDDYGAWAWNAPADELCPGGGESRGAAAERFAHAFGVLLARPEATVLAIAHALPIRYLLEAADGRPPPRFVEPVPYAEPFWLSASAVADAADVLAAWSREPMFEA